MKFPFGFISRVDEVIWPLERDSSADGSLANFWNKVGTPNDFSSTQCSNKGSD